MNLLRSLRETGALRAVDLALADTLRRLDPDTTDLVLAAAALASLAVTQGHAAFDLTRPQLLVDAALPWPDAVAWSQTLAASRWVATPASSKDEAEAAPLVLENNLLYLRRYREYERRLALHLHRIASHAIEGDGNAIAPLFATLFLLPLAGEDAQRADEGASEDRQARAATLALHYALLLVTGGPGTGKTTTITKLLALRIAQAQHACKPLPRIALAAPTGRAAERMAESLRNATSKMAALGIDDAVLAALPSGASTLHRLLGTIPDSPRFRHHAGNPLPFDIVVVDEASMVDLPLMCKLADAVADGAQLILLGDPDQLPSVEAGDVLASILDAASDDESPFPARRIHLLRGYRQSETLHLAPLADAVRSGDAAETLRLLRSAELPGIHFHEHIDDPLHARGIDLLAHWRTLATQADPARALQQASGLRLLTALREGPHGARGLNARIEAQLASRRIGSPPAWFPGRLLLIAENSYRHGLFNGDIGICLPDADGTQLAWFPGGSDGVRAFHPAALPAHESAFAMTVHKAQGSEHDTVWLQLPRADSPVLSRELLYTAITRARSALHIAGSAQVIETALSRHASRVSGLGWRLGQPVVRS
ncbi:MAG: exodeoxyribonuclease V subunit alpha [Thermomonas sp.]|uniref:exodeoxyribonuclease V subunit alpha n=1 Tax=Thermomonas sp. TaxID=1971895 RepID=UPI0039E40B76